LCVAPQLPGSAARCPPGSDSSLRFLPAIASRPGSQAGAFFVLGWGRGHGEQRIYGALSCARLPPMRGWLMTRRPVRTPHAVFNWGRQMASVNTRLRVGRRIVARPVATMLSPIVPPLMAVVSTATTTLVFPRIGQGKTRQDESQSEPSREKLQARHLSVSSDVAALSGTPETRKCDGGEGAGLGHPPSRAAWSCLAARHPLRPRRTFFYRAPASSSRPP